MKRSSIILVAMLGACTARPESGNLSRWVDPGIGTAHSRWFFYTPAAMPFGMAKPAPSTDGHLGNPGGWQAVGYDARHTSIEGFPNFHEFQIGGVVLMPTVGELKTVPGELDGSVKGYRSEFDKKDELADPGYYSVVLKDYGVRAELTATERVAFHRYTFPASGQSNILFDIGNRQGESGEVRDASVTFTEDGRVEGWVITYPVYVRNYQSDADVRMYFSAELDGKPASCGTFSGTDAKPGERTRRGAGAGLWLTFDTKEGEAVEVKVGLSLTSVENARLNLEAEARNLTFDKAHKRAVRKWEEMLGRVRVTGGKDADKTKFYTGLFHALLGRGLASDVNGDYPRNDGGVGHASRNHYNTDAIWGGFWNLTQLWALAYPEYYADWVSSQLSVFDETGWLGDGIAASKYVSGVGTNFTGLAIAAAYNVGIRDYDVETAYQAALKNEIGFENRPEGAGKLDTGLFTEYGYSPYDPKFRMRNTPEGSGFGASHTLEYSFSCYAVAQMAKALGKEEDYNRLMTLSEGWKLIFDPETKLMRPKGFDGEFIADFDPYAPWIGFQEGNAIQYTYYVPHDVETLVAMVGREEFNKRLDGSVEISRGHIFGGGRTVDAFAGLNTAYNHGNQPNLHIAWLFNFSGRPWLSQKWVRAICDEFYGTDGVHGYGYGQDEDQGQLGAWYVMAGIGLFDVGGLTSPTPAFSIGAPLFDRVEIAARPGTKFTIETSGEGEYVDAVELNGTSRKTLRLPFAEVMKGGVMKIARSATPNQKITH
jgi:predicted alpha-1,2-mannosidase